MIILAWTIERMSVLWDEEGAHEVLIQGAGSLLTASLAFSVDERRFHRRYRISLPRIVAGGFSRHHCYWKLQRISTV